MIMDEMMAEVTFTNNTPGYYWVQQHKNEQQITVGRLTKHSGWEYLYSRHNPPKMHMPYPPYKVIKKIQEIDEPTITVPSEIVQMIEYRRAAFEYAVIANLIEQNDFAKETVINYLREQSKRFTISHDDSQSKYAQKNAHKDG